MGQDGNFHLNTAGKALLQFLSSAIVLEVKAGFCAILLQTHYRQKEKGRPYLLQYLQAWLLLPCLPGFMSLSFSAPSSGSPLVHSHLCLPQSCHFCVSSSSASPPITFLPLRGPSLARVSDPRLLRLLNILLPFSAPSFAFSVPRGKGREPTATSAISQVPTHLR